MIVIGPNRLSVASEKVADPPPDLHGKLQWVMEYYRTRPISFCRHVIGSEPDEQQTEVLNAIAPRGSCVTVRSGKGVGKSSCAAWIVLWFLSCFTDCRVFCTAPTSHQLFDVLWPEIAKWRVGMNVVFGQEIEQNSERIFIKSDAKGRFAVARTSRPERPEGLQGIHARNVLVIIDEASGISDGLSEALEGARSSAGTRMLMLSNPTRVDGYFFNSHGKDRAYWKPIHLSGEHSRFTDKSWIEEVAKRHGRASNVFRVQVSGEFPTQSDDTLIPIDWCTSALGRDIDVAVGMRRIAGLDVARFGDDSNGLIVRDGPVVTHIEEWRHCDLMTTCGRVVDAYKEKRLFDTVYVDVIGMGSGVVDRLRELGVPCVGVNVAESPSVGNDGRFPRLRDQLWWSVREWFENRGCRIDPGLALADRLVGECSGIRYGYASSGAVKVEGKDELKKRGIPSPNLADALCLTFAPGENVQMIIDEGRMAALPIVNRDPRGWT